MGGRGGQTGIPRRVPKAYFNIFTKINIRKNSHILNRFMWVMLANFSFNFFATQQNVYFAMSTRTSVYCRKTADMYSIVLHTKILGIQHTHLMLYIFLTIKNKNRLLNNAQGTSFKLFCDPLRLPISPLTSKITTNSTNTAHYNCH